MSQSIPEMDEYLCHGPTVGCKKKVSKLFFFEARLGMWKKIYIRYYLRRHEVGY